MSEASLWSYLVVPHAHVGPYVVVDYRPLLVFWLRRNKEKVTVRSQSDKFRGNNKHTISNQIISDPTA